LDNLENSMEKLILVVHVLAAAAVIGLVLIQHGKGADMGAAFGSGASGSLFGVSGSSNLLSKLTAIFVAIFFATSLTLAYISSHRASSSSVVKAEAVPKAEVKEVESATEKAPAAKDIPN
jgi:preprotein translocase subunit SecG